MFGRLIRENKKVIHVNDIDRLLGNIELIDIREPYEYQMGSIVSAKNIPMGNLINEPDKYLSKENEYYIMCQSGGRSEMTCQVLENQGYQVINVAGGVGSYVGTKRK